MAASLPALGALLAARLLLLTQCIEQGPINSQLALGVAFASGQLSGLPSTQLAQLQDVLLQISNDYHHAARPETSMLTSPSLWLASSQPTRAHLSRLRPIRELYDSGRPNETESDSCLAEVTRCQATRRCLTAQTFGVATGYRLTHRLLYAIVADKMSCPDRDASQTRRLCSKILREAAAIARWGFPAEYQDLFTEQVALCGSLGHAEFLRSDWFRQIASWQLPSGCYVEQSGYPGHRTSVSAAALAVGIRAVTLAAVSTWLDV